MLQDTWRFKTGWEILNVWVGIKLGTIAFPTTFITSGENGLIDLGKLKIYAFVALARNPSGNSVCSRRALRGATNP